MGYNTALFKKLRFKFFALTASIFLVVIIGAFVTIYANTYIYVQQEISSRLDIARLDTRTFLPNETRNDSEYNMLADPLIVRINLSETQDILSVHSSLDIPQDLLEQLADPFRGRVFHTIDHSPYDNNGIMVRLPHSVEVDMPESDLSESISVGGRDWRVVSSITAFVVDDTEDFGFVEMGYSIVYMDVTDFNNTLSSLFYTLLTIGIAAFPIVGGISYYFAIRAVKPIEGAWEKQKRFIADASHELRTPITIIKSNLGIVMSNTGEAVDAQMEWLGYAKTGADRMSKLTNDLLTLAKGHCPVLLLQNEYFDVSTVIADLVNAMRASSAEKNIDITTSIQQNVSIYSDQEKIMQIASILLDNAIKHSNQNGSIHISLAAMNQGVCLAVTNSGKGISKSELDNIFDSFYQSEPSRKSDNEGFGLGLSIAKVITEKLGGKLSVVSGENDNTTFTWIGGFHSSH
jgi:signal transduction histidine kinase